MPSTTELSGNGDKLKQVQEEDRRRLKEFTKEGKSPKAFKDFIPKEDVLILPIKLSATTACKVTLTAPSVSDAWLAAFRGLQYRICPPGPCARDRNWQGKPKGDHGEKAFDLPGNKVLILTGRNVGDIRFEVESCLLADLNSAVSVHNK